MGVCKLRKVDFGVEILCIRLIGTQDTIKDWCLRIRIILGITKHGDLNPTKQYIVIKHLNFP